MKIETKIRKLIELRDEILEESKKWKQNKNPNICPLTGFTGFENSHKHLTEMITGVGCWRWECPFCKEEFQS